MKFGGNWGEIKIMCGFKEGIGLCKMYHWNGRSCALIQLNNGLVHEDCCRVSGMLKSVRHSLVQGHTQITRSSGERCISEAVLQIRHKSILTILPWLPM